MFSCDVTFSDGVAVAERTLCLFGIIYALLLLMPVPLSAMPGFLIRAVGLLYITFAGHSSIVGAWMFMFVMEIVRSVRKR